MSENRQEFLDRVEAAVNRLHVKAKLMEMELRDVRDQLRERFEEISEGLSRLREAADEGWEELKPRVDKAWDRLKRTFDSASHERSE